LFASLLLNNFVRQNPTLAAAIALSVLLHGGVLAVRIISPEILKYRPTDPELEVILVNAKHDKKPVKPEALAQADLDGGGNADAGRAKSPLPDLHKSDDGDDIKVAHRHIAELEEEQEKMLAQVKDPKTLNLAQNTTHDKPQDKPVQPDGTDKTDSTKAFTRDAAEISKRVEEYNTRPKKTQITPSTLRVEYALYYKAMKTRIEKFGTRDFPQQNGKRLYGNLLVSIPIYQDGNIYEKEGGPRIERSSGNPALDKAALRIVRQAAPFDQFKANMRTKYKNDVWEVITRFKFTREEGLEAEMRGSEE
jgi:protein TonB